MLDPVGETIISVRDIFVNHGVQQGIKQGRQETLRYLVSSMLKNGFSEMQIAQCTGLSISEIDQFKLEARMF